MEHEVMYEDMLFEIFSSLIAPEQMNELIREWN